MPRQSLLDEINAAVLAKYGSYSSPTFFFQRIEVDRDDYKAVMADVRKIFDVREDTDLNIDVCFVFMLKADARRWVLSMSMVGPYAAVFRGIGDCGVSLVDTPSDDSLERDLFDILRKYSVDVLPRDVLETPCPLRLGYVRPPETLIYHALFTDTDPLPWHA